MSKSTNKEYYSVSEITLIVKELLESNLNDVTVIGELSNFKPHSSGHWYFTLKDGSAQISCTMWKGLNSYVFFTPQDGMKVILRGRVTVYAPRGTYQLDVKSMQPAGAGDLQLAFEALKNKLNSEGLFDEENKVWIPEMPERIGIITAREGAAIRDMYSVAKRRFPLVELYLISCQVQGAGAAEQIAAALDQFNDEKNVDVIILGRGGGSIEDLWCFNEEIVARAIFRSEIPVITGIGHEIDFTIADFVADLRAATPTAAMEMVLPDQNEIIGELESKGTELEKLISDRLTEYNNRISGILSSRNFNRPVDTLRTYSQKLDYENMKFTNLFDGAFERIKTGTIHLTEKIYLHNPERIIKKGFVLVKQANKFVGRGSQLFPGDEFELHFFDKKINILPNDKDKKSSRDV